MTEGPTVLFLEADDEITAVVRRVRAADAGRVVLVAPGRSRATSSAVGLRLLARAGEADGRDVSVVGDPLTRSLAAEAGLVAYASVDEARRGDPSAQPDAAEPRHAAIHVVRGAATDETVPTMAAAMAAVPDDETRAVKVAQPSPKAAAAPGRRFPIVLTAGLVALLAAAAALAVFVLPSATIRIEPETSAVGPATYDIRVEGAESVSGTVEATATVTATGTYEVLEPATGFVVFFNWNVFDVEVPAETLVAAGEQAFATVETIVVPAGSLTSDGRIQAGDASMEVTAAAAGPAANVPPEAIDTILSIGTAAQLRGFPNNPERLVTNPEATSGGLEGTGTEISQGDVDAASAALQQDLAEAAAAALAGTTDDPYADPAEPPAPVIEGIEGLVGTRDQPSAEITGTLAYDRLVADPAEVEGLAVDRFASDATLLAEGHELVPDATNVTLGETTRDGDALVVAATVEGQSAAAIDPDEVIERAAGRTAAEAEEALADIGEATVELWPGWVITVPDAEWRIEVESVTDAGEPSPSGS